MRSVMLVEDEPLVRSGLRALIDWEKCGFCVRDAVANGLQALELMRSRAYDLLITDVRMPVVGGIELIKALRDAGNEVPAIVISGYREFEYAKSAMELGVRHYLLKPVGAEELAARLAAIRAQLDAEAPPVWRAPICPSEAPSASPGAQSQAVVSAIKQYVAAHYAEELSLTRLGGVFFMNAVYMGHLFSEVEGCGFREYLTRYRIRRAADMLRDPALRATDISVASGFVNLNYFYRCFRQEMGCSPSAYRRDVLALTRFVE